MTIRYISTRGKAPILGFEDVVLAGLASDGGLYVPDSLPQFSAADIGAFAKLSYVELAARILEPFTAECLDGKSLRELLTATYAGFRHPDIAPIKQLAENQYLLELFHGPTLAFKDFALQFLGRLLDHILKKQGRTATVLGATSGDTGSAAIAGCGGRENMQIFILHPHNRVSEVQRRQMTTVLDANVHNIALKGSFDDCQNIVKSLFSDQAFRTKHQLAAVNSINWARILAQVVYYFYAGAKLGRVSFSVPTGNFGDIYAGYIAKRMGLPIDRLIIATNRNDILARCLKSGTYATRQVMPTLSPSMDIQVSSNFERLLFDLNGRDGAKINTMMQQFRETGSLAIDPTALALLRTEFSAHTADDEITKATIRAVYDLTGELVDPHTAVGLTAAREVESASPVVTLATAHPAKFPEAVKAATGERAELPEHLADLMQREERYDVLENNDMAVRDYIAKRG